MRILIVTPLFPPQNAVGALRPYSWAKYWCRDGHSVDVYTVESYGVDSGLNINLQNLNVVALPVPFISRMAKKWHNANNNSQSAGTNNNNKSSIFGKAKKLYRNFIDKTGCIMGVRYPDMRDLWARNVIKNIDPKKYDLVVSTGCPYSVHKVCYYVKKKNPKAFWILDWRDLWTLNPYWKGLKIFNSYEKKLERKFHTIADVITVVSDGLKDDLKKLTSNNIVTIPNGYDKEDYSTFMGKEKSNRNNKKITCVYTGTIYKGVQDITPFLKAIRELLDEKRIQENQIEFIAAGNVADLLQDIEYYKLQNVFTFKGFISRAEALKLTYNCDIALLLLGKNNKGILTGKLFEYLTLADYTLGVDFSNESDAGRIICEANAGYCFDSNVEEIKDVIMKKLEEKNKGIYSIKNNSIIEQFDRRLLTEKMLELVK